jgi:ElaB/YqjD/DUF883 family membrane-anchored ribosome-binding protein
MLRDNHLIFENYVDGITKRKGELASNIMDIVRYGIPSKEEFIKIRQELHDKVKEIKERGTPATEEEQARGKQLIGMIKSYRAQHPNDPPFVRNLHDPAENAEDVSNNIRTKLGQAHDIVKGLIEMLDKTPTEQTPYNEMAITHIVNLEEDVKTLSQMLQDRMLKKSENAESADEKKERVQRGWDINKKRWAKWKAENPEAAAKHAARKAGKSENAENEPHGYPQGMTAIQNLIINELKKRGFQLNKVSHANIETEGYPTVFMYKKSGPMHSVAEVSGMGEINGEPYRDYLANHKYADEDAEGRSRAQQAAIAISLQKAGKKPS